MSPTLIAAKNEQLAILGGPKAVPADKPELFTWPIVTPEDEQAVLEVLRAGKMSGTDISMKFEAEFAAWQGCKFALAHCNGTSALLAAMFGVGVGRGDEVICPSMTYWASAMPAFTLGATVVFADMDPQSLCIDPADIEHRITPRTKAIVVVHYCGHPCDMDPIMAIAKKHGLKVVEDVSHAHGARYKGRLCGSIGHVGAMSMMAGKSFPIGEGGMLCTDDRAIYERAIALGHYERTWGDTITLPELKPFTGMPLAGYKFRINQTCSAMGRVQLKHYDQRVTDIQAAMNRFWDLLEGVPGLRPHRPAKGTNTTMGGWYNPLGHYVPEELAGLPVGKFIEAVTAEGGRCGRACNSPLHLHPVFNTVDGRAEGIIQQFLGAGKGTTGRQGDGATGRGDEGERRGDMGTRGRGEKGAALGEKSGSAVGLPLRSNPGTLPATEALAERCFGIPWFKHDQPESIARYAAAFAKVALQADRLLT